MNRGVFGVDMLVLGGMAPRQGVKPDVPLKSIKYNYPDRGGYG